MMVMMLIVYDSDDDDDDSDVFCFHNVERMRRAVYFTRGRRVHASSACQRMSSLLLTT